MNTKKAGSKLLFILVIVVIFLVIINQPVISGNAAGDFWSWLNSAASKIGNFLGNL